MAATGISCQLLILLIILIKDKVADHFLCLADLHDNERRMPDAHRKRRRGGQGTFVQLSA